MAVCASRCATCTVLSSRTTGALWEKPCMCVEKRADGGAKEERTLGPPRFHPLDDCLLVQSICRRRLQFQFGFWGVDGRARRPSCQGTRQALSPAAFLGRHTSVPGQQFGQETEASRQGGGSLGLDDCVGGVTMRLADPHVMRPATLFSCPPLAQSLINGTVMVANTKLKRATGYVNECKWRNRYTRLICRSMRLQ